MFRPKAPHRFHHQEWIDGLVPHFSLHKIKNWFIRVAGTSKFIDRTEIESSNIFEYYVI